MPGWVWLQRRAQMQWMKERQIIYRKSKQEVKL